MKKQVIAIDIDDVLAASAEARVIYSNEKWGTNLTLDDYEENWAKMWNVDVQEASRRGKSMHNDSIVLDFEHHEAALPVLSKLAKAYKLVIATSRTQPAHADSIEWLEKHYKGLFSGFHASGIFEVIDKDSHLQTKAELVKQIGADYLIDDQPKHCLAVADLGIETILFGDYSWNCDIGEVPPRVTRCFDWKAVGEYFDERS